MEQLKQTTGLMIQQKKEWGEMLTSFETSNRYIVHDQDGLVLCYADEESSGIGSFLSRQFFQALRPFTIRMMDTAPETVLIVKRPFRFYFHQAEILDASGYRLGYIKRDFAIVRRRYTVYGEDDQPVFTLFGPLLHPWTFNVLYEEQQIGVITKKWSGLFTEGFTDADNFAVQYPLELDPVFKTLLLGAVFLIDFVHFERKSNNN